MMHINVCMVYFVAVECLMITPNWFSGGWYYSKPDLGLAGLYL